MARLYAYLVVVNTFRLYNLKICDSVQTMEDPITQLQSRVEESSQVLVAAELGVSQQYLSAVLRGLKAPGKSILKALGLERSVVYVRANGKGAKRAGR